MSSLFRESSIKISGLIQAVLPVVLFALMVLTGAGLPCASEVEAAGSQPLGDLEIGDRVVDPSWEWEFRTGDDRIFPAVNPTSDTFVSVAKNADGIYEIIPAGSDPDLQLSNLFERVDQEIEGLAGPDVLYFIDRNNVVAGNSAWNFTDGGAIYYCQEGGLKLERVEERVAPLRGFAFEDSQIGYAVGSLSRLGVSMYVGKTTDGGKTWQPIHENMRNVLS